MSNPPSEATGGTGTDLAATKPGETPEPKEEEPPKPASESVEEDDDDDDKSIKSEGADEEDALFTTLEQHEEEEEAAHPHIQPKDATAAPMLLQSALAKGDVSMDDSDRVVEDSKSKAEEEKKGDENTASPPESSLIHQRVRFLF